MPCNLVFCIHTDSSSLAAAHRLPQGGGFFTARSKGGSGEFPASKGGKGGIVLDQGTYHTDNGDSGGGGGVLGPGRKHLKPCDMVAFDVGRVLGTGSFGRVSFARHKETGTLVAIKVLSKAEIIRTRQVEHIRAEKTILDKAGPYTTPHFSAHLKHFLWDEFG